MSPGAINVEEIRTLEDAISVIKILLFRVNELETENRKLKEEVERLKGTHRRRRSRHRRIL
jgi:hypothetical protein